LSFAETALSRGGNFVVKIFQGGETNGFLKKAKVFFKTAQTYKPQACRSESFEVYFLGLDKK